MPPPPHARKGKTKTKGGGRTGYDSSHNKNIFSLYCIVPQVHFAGFLCLKPNTTAAEFRCVPGKIVISAKKDSKKLSSVQKVLRK